MENIVPLDGFMIATLVNKSCVDIETEISEVKGMKFLTVDSQSKRSQIQDTKTRVRLFNIMKVSENANDKIKKYIGNKLYCICFEKEDANNIIVDKTTGDKLFILNENDALAKLIEE